MSCKVVLESKIKPEVSEEIQVFLEENLPNVRSYKGCKSVHVLLNDVTNEMIFYEDWKSKEDHQNYINFINKNGVLEELSSFLETAPSIKYFEELII
ncbi:MULTISPECIES: putative quinol monooxygenase [Aquimarina]|uniref:Antibiotic biosynthesis monooxygenase n=1 Tax=Aquimarina algiphila TaxID=2047982 RepID=A0A554VB87_9FLAO|nr:MULTISPECIES: antibiotic biosynthesis monooxygenase family protein [Aquimarina]TSE03765.1 antibiotic biosynthesis monooxygenase [Aquimarina algiphila]